MQTQYEIHTDKDYTSTHTFAKTSQKDCFS